ncbi:hypothetical protein J2Y37_003141 [Prolinoborus sp. 3657]|nr:hypothetical protein [Prolinoborus sp. 3657]
MTNVYIQKPHSTDLVEIKRAYQNSIQLHQPWIYPPSDFKQYLNKNIVTLFA